MESELEIDSARQEASAQQAVDSALGQSPPSRNLAPTGRSSDARSNEQPGRYSRGRSATTSQPRLKPKTPHEQRSPSPLPDRTGTAGSVDLGEDNDGLKNAFRLQPVDEGFGAWSYVASAFAMYIVVWG